MHRAHRSDAVTLFVELSMLYLSTSIVKYPVGVRREMKFEAQPQRGRSRPMTRMGRRFVSATWRWSGTKLGFMATKALRDDAPLPVVVLGVDVAGPPSPTP